MDEEVGSHKQNNHLREGGDGGGGGGGNDGIDERPPSAETVDDDDDDDYRQDGDGAVAAVEEVVAPMIDGGVAHDNGDDDNDGDQKMGEGTPSKHTVATDDRNSKFDGDGAVVPTPLSPSFPPASKTATPTFATAASRRTDQGRDNEKTRPIASSVGRSNYHTDLETASSTTSAVASAPPSSNQQQQSSTTTTKERHRTDNHIISSSPATAVAGAAGSTGAGDDVKTRTSTAMEQNGNLRRPGAVAVSRLGQEEDRRRRNSQRQRSNEAAVTTTSAATTTGLDDDRRGVEEANHDTSSSIIATGANDDTYGNITIPPPGDNISQQPTAQSTADDESRRRRATNVDDGRDNTTSYNSHNEDSSHQHQHLVEADLVEVLPPTVHAVSVYIDEEDPLPHHNHYHPSVSPANGSGVPGRVPSSSNQVSPLEIEQQDGHNNTNNVTSSSSSSQQQRGGDIGHQDNKNVLPQWLNCPRWCQKWQYRAIFWTGVALLILMLALLFLIDQDQDGFDRQKPPPPPVLPQVGSVTCYNSTRDLFLAQVYDFVERDFTSTADEYVMCPGTNIEVGVLQNPAIGDFKYVDGDYPIIILQPNTTIRCGGGHDDDEGNIEKNDKYDDNDRRPDSYDDDAASASSESQLLCQLNGGFMQVSMVGYVESYFDMDGAQGQDRVNLQVAKEILSKQVVNLDNVTIEGMTFTGDIETVSNFPGSSVIMGQPGDVEFVNCQWTNMTATSGVISMFEVQELKVLNDTLFNLPRLTSQILLKNCLFDEIVYENPILMVTEQRMHVEDSVFRNISPSPFAKGRECTFEWLSPPSSTTGGGGAGGGGGGADFDQTPLVFKDGCTNLMTCVLRSQCSITNSCFENVDSSASPGLIFMAEPGTVVVSTNVSSPSTNVSSSVFDVDATMDDASLIASSYGNYIDTFSQTNTNCVFFVSETIDGGNANLDGSRTCLDEIPFGGDSSQCTISTTSRRRNGD